MSRKTKRMNDGLRVDRLPGVGLRYEVTTIDDNRLTVVIDHQGDRHVNLRSGKHMDDPGASAVISPRQSSLLALILSDTFEIAEAAISDGEVIVGRDGLSREGGRITVPTAVDDRLLKAGLSEAAL